MKCKTPRNYLQGGKVRGPGTATSDSILARISNGEYVLPKPAVDMLGVQNLEAIRREALTQTPRYALGGPISGGLNFQNEQEPTSTTFYPTGTPTTTAPSFGNAPSGTNTGIKLGGTSSATTPGTLNSYGNDMTLTNRMNAGAEQMRLMREGPIKPKQPDYMTGLKSLLSLLGSQQQNQDTLGNTDVLGSFSKLFGQNNVPGMAQGGLIGQEQWEGLPRFANGTPADYPGYFSGERGKSVYDFLIGVPKAEQQRREIANAPPAVPVNSAATFNMMDGKRIMPPAPPLFAGQGDPLAGRLPDVSGLTSYTMPQGPAPAPLPTTPGPGAGGYENRDGIYRKVETAPGFGPTNPNRVPAPGQSAGTTQYVVPGATSMGGGASGSATFQGLPKSGGFLGYVGTPETKGMTQAEATAYNVGNINRQTEAMRSLREARNPGITTGGSALPEAPAPIDIWARPGDSFGDSQFRQAQYESLLENAGKQRGLGSKRRAAAMIDAAQSLVAPGLATAKLNAEQAQKGQELAMQAGNQQLLALANAQKLTQDQAQWAAQHGIDVTRLNNEQQKQIADIYRSGVGNFVDVNRLIMDAGKTNPVNSGVKPEVLKLIYPENLVTEGPNKGGKRYSYNPETATQIFGPVPEDKAKRVAYQIYAGPNGLVMFDQEGNPRSPLGSPSGN